MVRVRNWSEINSGLRLTTKKMVFTQCIHIPSIHGKKSQTPFVAMTMVAFGSPAFRLYGIRDFLSLPYDKFGFRK